MKKYQKIYWKTRNILHAPILKLIGNKGLLTPRDNGKDYISEFGAGILHYLPKHKSINLFRFQFNQSPFNICTFAAAIMAVSEQLGIRLSVRFYVIDAKRRGRINGNGFCDQRTVMDILCEIGIVTYEEFPDEINGMSWKQYSAITNEFLEIRTKVRNTKGRQFTEYKKIKTESGALEAIDNLFVLIMASKWLSGMNRPKAPKFILNMIGYFVGWHQYRSTGYREYGQDFATPQTFGEHYGDKGMAWSTTLFGKKYASTYYLHYQGGPLLPTSVLAPIFVRQNEGNMVKAYDHQGDPRCYVIENGKKRWVSGDDEMHTFFSLFEKKGLIRINKKLLEAIPQGENYPLI